MRVAIYFAPSPHEDLWHFGSGLLGYDAATSADLGFPLDLPVSDPEWLAWTEDPRRYGFHATLKAPFRLAAGIGLADVERIASDIGAQRSPFRIEKLDVRLIGSFVALVPSRPEPALDDLAASCVEAFDPLRAPLTAAERARRLATPLSTRQMELLDRYGYPYVLDQFHFHMTLTGSLPVGRAEAVRSLLAERYADQRPGLTIDSICLFVQGAPAERFRIRRRIPLAGHAPVGDG